MKIIIKAKNLELTEDLQNFIEKKIDDSYLLPKDLASSFKISDNSAPFYPFFIWLNVNYKVLYLEVKEHEDTYTTIVYNQLNQPMLYHSWYSRSFGLDQLHTKRINNLYRSCVNKEVLFSFSEKIKIEIEKFCNQKLIPFVLPIRRVIIKVMK